MRTKPESKDPGFVLQECLVMEIDVRKTPRYNARPKRRWSLERIERKEARTLGQGHGVKAVQAKTPIVGSHAITASVPVNLVRHLEMVEREFVAEAIRQSNGSRVRAAALLHIDVRSLRYRLQKLDMSFESILQTETVSAP